VPSRHLQLGYEDRGGEQAVAGEARFDIPSAGRWLIDTAALAV